MLLSLAAVLAWLQPAHGEEWGLVTVQSNHSYGYTYPLLPGTVKDLQDARGSGSVHVADSPNNARVGSVLSQIGDGGVLVINTHSTADVFGVGNTSADWTEFYSTFGANPPPKLGLVIIHGCLANYDSNGNSHPSTDAQIERIRQALGADAIISYNVEIDPRVARLSLQGIIKGVSAGQPISSLIHGSNVRFITAPGVDRDRVTINDLSGGRTTPPPPPPSGPSITGLSVSSVLASSKTRTPTATETVVEATVQFFVTGIPPGHADSVNYQGSLVGPGGTSQPVSGSFSVPGGGYQAGGFLIRLPNSAPEGQYTLKVGISGGTASASGEGKFSLAYPNLAYGLTGPATVNEGESCELSAQVTNGVPPYRWEWSGGGGAGSGSGMAFKPSISSAAPPNLKFTVKVWDGAHSASAPVVRTHTVKVEKKSPDLTVSVSGPTETAVGRKETFSATATGGTGLHRFEWITHTGQTVPKSSLSGGFSSPGTFDLTARVFDEGDYQTTPKTAVVRVEVFGRLEGGIQGPTEAPAGKRITLTPDLRGGKPELDYLWTNSEGRQSRNRVISGTMRGQPGDIKIVRLDVEDGLNPPQTLHLEKRIRVTLGPEIQITSLEVSPSSIDPGQSARVTVSFLVRGFDTPAVTVFGEFFLEGSSGSGRGWTQKVNYGADQSQSHKMWANFQTSTQGKSGPIRAVVNLKAGDLVVSQTATAELKREGGLQDVTVDSRNVRMKIWDHGSEDGDIVSIHLNGAQVGAGKITKAGGIINLNLVSGENKLVVKAHNEGSSSPNTAAIQLTNVVKGPASQSYNLKTGREGYFYIVAP